MTVARIKDRLEIYLILAALAVGMLVILSFYTIFGPWIRE